jgi:hypothetical protein
MDLFPSLPLAGWAGSKETVHRFLQVVGKIRLGASVRRNHWWNVPFYVTGRGLTTRPMWSAGRDAIFAIDFDLVAHELQINHLDGRRVSIPLTGQSVASFHDRTHEALQGLGIEVSVPRDTPFDLPDSGRPFGQDAEHDNYDPVAVNTYWRVLSEVSLIPELFSAGYSGKVSPVASRAGTRRGRGWPGGTPLVRPVQEASPTPCCWRRRSSARVSALRR